MARPWGVQVWSMFFKSLSPTAPPAGFSAYCGAQSGPEDEARWLADRAHGDLFMVEGAGHYPHAEMPEQVGPKIAAFLLEHGKGL